MGKELVTSNDFKVELEDYNVEASTAMQEMEASGVMSLVVVTRP